MSKAKLVGYKLAVNSNAQIQSIALHNRKLAVAAGDTVELFDLECQRSEGTSTSSRLASLPDDVISVYLDSMLIRWS